MSLKQLLYERKDQILNRWFTLIAEGYPTETTQFLSNQSDRFANPVGHSLKKGLDGILTSVIEETIDDETSDFLDNIIRVRAVQDFTPSTAAGFLIFLKQIIREILQIEIKEGKVGAEELLDTESRIDSLLLMSFDIFIKCREKIYEIRANEAKHMTYRLLERAKLICELKDEEMPSWDSLDTKGQTDTKVNTEKG